VLHIASIATSSLSQAIAGQSRLKKTLFVTRRQYPEKINAVWLVP